MSESKHTPQERIARALCRLLDDEWRLGKGLYMSTAAEIMEDIGYSDMLEALKGFNLKEEWIVGGQADSLTLRVPLSVIRAAAEAVAKATGES